MPARIGQWPVSVNGLYRGLMTRVKHIPVGTRILRKKVDFYVQFLVPTGYFRSPRFLKEAVHKHCDQYEPLTNTGRHTLVRIGHWPVSVNGPYRGLMTRVKHIPVGTRILRKKIYFLRTILVPTGYFRSPPLS